MFILALLLENLPLSVLDVQLKKLAKFLEFFISKLSDNVLLRREHNGTD